MFCKFGNGMSLSWLQGQGGAGGRKKVRKDAK